MELRGAIFENGVDLIRVSRILEKGFIRSAGIILIVTSLAKILSAMGHAHMLEMPDPLFGVAFRYLMLLAGFLELVIGLFCLTETLVKFRLYLVVWIASCFLGYRIALWRIGWRHPCPCLGTWTDSLHLSAEAADSAMKLVLGYLLLGSLIVFFTSFISRRLRRDHGR